MVKTHQLAIFLLCIFLSSPIFAEEVSILAEIEAGSTEDAPLKGNVTVTHDQGQTVDTGTFKLGKDKLSVQFVREVKISPNDPLVLSIYSFSLPGQKEGLYALPSISVKVGGKTYNSPMSSYSVGSKGTAPPPSQPAPAPVAPPSQSQPAPAPKPFQVPADMPAGNVKPSLRLESVIDGSDSLYPGQRTKLVYRYYFTGDIALSTETLPLLDAEGFVKIGEKEITDAVQGNVSIRQISQQVEAVLPGKYTLGPSVIEGYAYKEDTGGNKVPLSDKITSQAPAVTITVMPFPEQGKPASFNGAVGQFTFQSSLLTPHEMTVGDKLSLEFQISGKGNLKNITISDLCCQPGISGFFRLSDRPPNEEISGETKKIVAVFSPLNAQIKEIPSLEFSFFDPEKGGYAVLHSQPIPVTVKAGPNPLEEALTEMQTPVPEQPSTSDASLKTAAVPDPIAIESLIPLKTCDLYNRPFGTWWALTIIPFTILLLIYQSHLRDYLTWRKGQRTVFDSQGLFQQAFAERKEGKVDFDVLKKSFKRALMEAGLIPSEDIADKDLPEEGLSKEVKVFCALIDEKRFSEKGVFNTDEIYRLSQELMSKVNVVTRNKSQGTHV